MPELEKIIGADDTATSGEEKKAEETTPSPEQSKSEALLKEERELENLRKAKAEAQDELRKLRQEKKAIATPEAEDIPKIDMDDPSAKAWDRHIKENVNPLQSELQKEKEEVVGLALDEFLSERPALAANPEKRKELMETYQALARSRGITERNKDVVKSVMESAYGAVFHADILERERQQRIAQARADGTLAEVATDGGSTVYRNDTRKVRKQLSRDETDTAIKMYGSVEAYWQAIDALDS